MGVGEMKACRTTCCGTAYMREIEATCPRYKVQEARTHLGDTAVVRRLGANEGHEGRHPVGCGNAGELLGGNALILGKRTSITECTPSSALE